MGNCKKNAEKTKNSYLNKNARGYCLNAKVGPAKMAKCISDRQARMITICRQRTGLVIARNRGVMQTAIKNIVNRRIFSRGHAGSWKENRKSQADLPAE
jgi:hypothetical protein